MICSQKAAPVAFSGGTFLPPFLLESLWSVSPSLVRPGIHGTGPHSVFLVPIQAWQSTVYTSFS